MCTMMSTPPSWSLTAAASVAQPSLVVRSAATNKSAAELAGPRARRRQHARAEVAEQGDGCRTGTPCARR